jgi:hypothetical protein
VGTSPIANELGPIYLAPGRNYIPYDAVCTGAWIEGPSKHGIVMFSVIAAWIQNYNINTAANQYGPDKNASSPHPDYGTDPTLAHYGYQINGCGGKMYCPHNQDWDYGDGLYWTATGMGSPGCPAYFMIFDPADADTVANNNGANPQVAAKHFQPLQDICPTFPDWCFGNTDNRGLYSCTYDEVNKLLYVLFVGAYADTAGGGNGYRSAVLVWSVNA